MTKVQCQDLIEEFFNQEIINDKKKIKKDNKKGVNNSVKKAKN